MALNASKVVSEGNFTKQENIEIGTYAARLVQVIDLGMHAMGDYDGKAKPPANKMWLTYELGMEFMKDEDGKDLTDKPRWISEELPLRSMESDNANSTARLKAMDSGNEVEGDFSKLLSSALNITVVHKEKNGKTYDNVGDTTPPMKGFEAPALVNETVLFLFDDPDVEVFKALPDFLQKKIKGSLDYNGGALQQLLGEEPIKEAPPEKAAPPAKPAAPKAPAAPAAPQQPEE